MKYTREQRLDIGRRIYEGEFSRFEAASEYDISPDTARSYMRLYRHENHLPARDAESKAYHSIQSCTPPDQMEDYQAMSKDELIRELILSKINEARLKKGYEVKGVGAQKEFIPLGSRNTK